MNIVSFSGEKIRGKCISEFYSSMSIHTSLLYAGETNCRKKVISAATIQSVRRR